MNRDGTKGKIGNKIIVRIGLFIFSLYFLFARQLNQFVRLKPIKVVRYGKTFIVSGNLEYFSFWKYTSREEDSY